eukprot:TRINITY_DN90891_c0_g1_i1.p1 TRINITY_DN90891_c0_g1~~TRINITY_DN90891_c0_g1_i1.p1  ORF type:complete len:396 (-),score=46.67 TRINITY_DN90891_c0_g1_i1:306-1445(-)
MAAQQVLGLGSLALSPLLPRIHLGLAAASAQLSAQVAERELLARYMAKPPSAMTLQDLHDIGRTQAARRVFAEPLRLELCSRFARAALELRRLPATPGISEVAGKYINFVFELDALAPRHSAAVPQRFGSTLRACSKFQRGLFRSLGHSISSLSRELGHDYQGLRPLADEVLRRVFSCQIGSELLISQYSNLYTAIQLECNPKLVAEKTAANVREVCSRVHGSAPQILICQSQGGTLACVPAHLEYILQEILKNACCAVVRAQSHAASLPAITCKITHSSEAVEVCISDLGGGMSPSSIRKAWSFTHTGGCKSAWGDQGSDDSTMSGYGLGLPLSRLYAGHFGGDLQLTSWENWGTEVCLTLSKQMTRSERLWELSDED